MSPQRELIHKVCAIMRAEVRRRGVAFPRYRYLKFLTAKLVQGAKALQEQDKLRRI